MSAAMERESPSEPGYEKKDLDPSTIALLAAGGGVVLLLTAALAFWMVQSANQRYAVLQSSRRTAQMREARPEPRLQVQGSKELREMRKAEDGILNSYGWVDREKGIVRIPVERAMELLAAQEGMRRQAGGNRDGQ